MTINGFTKTEQAIIDLLSDGKPHSRQELHGCLSDDLATPAAVRYHLVNIRKKLRPKQQDLICEYANRRVFYRHVRLLSYGAIRPESGRVCENLQPED